MAKLGGRMDKVGRLVAKLREWVANIGRWVDKIAGWVAKLVERPLVSAAFWLRTRHRSKIIKMGDKIKGVTNALWPSKNIYIKV
jgi:hypothetical protein